MANNIKKLLPTDIISDSMDKINSNFDILSSYSVFSDKSLTEYYKKIDDLVNQISGKVDLSESRLNIEFEKIRGEIKDYNDDASSINQTADMIQSTVSSLNKKFDGTVEKMQSQFTQTANNINSVVQSYRDENKADYDAINMVLASIEISRRCYEFYNQYVIKIKPQRKNIIQPEIQDFYERCIKSLEEFGVTGEFKDFKSLYDFFKNSKMMYRVSLDCLNPKFFSLKSTKSLVRQMTSSC